MPEGTQRLEVATPSGAAWIDFDDPGSATALLVLGHGAGGGVEAPDLRAVCAAVLTAGVAVARVTQPYRVVGRRSPAPAPRLDEAWLAVDSVLQQRTSLAGLPFVHGGRSSGARVACRTAHAAGAAAVVALAFPVHPPGRPERSRLDELALPDVPVLVVQGARDPFGMPPPDPRRRLVVLAAADHSLRQDARAVGAAVVDFLAGIGLSTTPVR